MNFKNRPVTRAVLALLLLAGLSTDAVAQYCASTSTSNSFEYISNVSSGSFSNTSARSHYASYVGLGAINSVAQGASFDISITVTGAYNEDALYVYLDVDQNNILTQSEMIGRTNYNSGGSGVTGTRTASCTVPAGALTGDTRLRIKMGDTTANMDQNPCQASFTYGEVEDYVLNVFTLVPCSGTPNPGNTMASSTSVCSGGSVSLSLQNPTTGTGVTYQWNNGSGPIAGATSSSYTTPALTAGDTYYCDVTCSGSTGSSTPVSITMGTAPVGGTASGTTSGVTYATLSYSVTGYSGGLQWQYANAVAGPYTDLTGQTSPTMNTTASSAGTFYIRCKASNAGCTDDFSTVVTTVVTVAGDNVCSALTLPVGNSGPYTNAGATSETGEVTPPGDGCNTQTGWCGSGYTINSVWFTFTPTTTGDYSFGLNGTMTLFDSQLGLYSASSCSPFSGFTLIAANDDSNSTPYNSFIAPVCLEGGVTYYLLVDGYSSTTASNWGIRVTGTSTTYYADADGDGYGNAAVSAPGCAAGLSGYVANDDDADDTDPYITTTPCAACTAQPGKGMPKKPGKPVADVTVGVCPGETRTFTTLPADTLACYFIWTVPTGATITSGQGTTSITVSFDAGFTGAGDVTVYAHNACGNSVANLLTVKLGLAPKAPTLTGPTVAGCSMTGVAYSIVTPIAGLTYNWTWTDGTHASVASGQGTDAITADFTFGYTQDILSVTAANGCGTGPAKTLTVKNGANPAAPDTVLGDVVAGCGLTGIAYSVMTPVPGNTYTWAWDSLGNIGAVVASGQGSSSVTVDYNTAFTKGALLVTTTDGCGVSKAYKKKVKKGPVPTTGPITGENWGVCSQEGVAYSSSSVSFAGSPSYDWAFVDPATGSIASGQGTANATVDYASGFSATGVLTVTASDGCGTGKPVKYTIWAKPVKPEIPAGPAIVCAGSSQSYATSPVYGATDYTWTAPSAATISDGVTTSVSNTMTTTSTTVTVNFGTKPGKVSVKANAPCGSSGASSLTVDTSCAASKPVFQSAGNGMLTVDLVPNPATDQVTIHINGSDEGTATVRLLSITGQQMAVEQLQSVQHSHVSIPLHNLAAGLYLVEVTTGGQKITRQLVKQ